MDNRLSQREVEIFETMSVPKAVAALAVPTVISQIIAMVYNLADTWYIGQLNDTNMMAAVTLIFPVFLMLSALANLFGIGGASLLSRSLGEHNYARVREAGASSAWMAVAATLAYSLVTMIWRVPLLRMLGADDGTIDYASGYLFWTVAVGGLPTVMIPTTAGSGSEVSAVAVFSFPEDKMKKGVASGNMVADAALVDPLLTLGLPAHITAAAGMDALVHAVESYLSLGTNRLTQDLALAAIRKIVPNLALCVREPGNIEARTAQAYGSLTAGMAFAMSGTAGVHAMAYPLGGEFHVPHGEANTAMLRWVMEYNLDGCPERFVPIAEAMGVRTEGMSPERAASAALDAMIALGEECGVKTRLRDFGIPKEACSRMAPAAMKEKRLIGNNPRRLTEEAVRKIYERAW